MECPFGLPVRAIGKHFAEGFYYKAECKNEVVLFLCPTKADVDYIVQAINRHEKLMELLKDAQRYIRPLDPKFREIEQALKAEKP